MVGDTCCQRNASHNVSHNIAAHLLKALCDINRTVFMETLLTRTPWVLLPFLSANVWTYGHARVHSGVRGWAHSGPQFWRWCCISINLTFEEATYLNCTLTCWNHLPDYYAFKLRIFVKQAIKHSISIACLLVCKDLHWQAVVLIFLL